MYYVFIVFTYPQNILNSIIFETAFYIPGLLGEFRTRVLWILILYAHIVKCTRFIGKEGNITLVKRTLRHFVSHRP